MSEPTTVKPDADHLLAEIEQVFAEVIASAESRRALSSYEREQAELAVEQVMEITRQMVARLATAGAGE